LPEKFQHYIFGTYQVLPIKGWMRVALETYSMLMLEIPLNVKEFDREESKARLEKYLERLDTLIK
jgi:hypothetical protein